MRFILYPIRVPRSSSVCKAACKEKGHEAEYALYEKVEQMAPEVIGEKRKMYKGVNANVDFYSGLVYSMLDLPHELYTNLCGGTYRRMECSQTGRA